MLKSSLKMSQRVLLPLACFGMAWFLGEREFVRMLEWRTLDWRTQLRTYFQPAPDPRIAVVLFDETTHSAINWPPDRSVHGDFIAMSSLVKPAVISFDVILDASREGEGDARMAGVLEAVAAEGVTVLTASVTSPEAGLPDGPNGGGPTQPLKNVEGDVSQVLGDEYAALPFPKLRAVSLYGFVDTPPGRDGYRREVPLLARVGEKLFPSLSLQTVMAYYGIVADEVKVRLGDAIYLPTKVRGELRVPISESGRLVLNYRYDRDDLRDDFLTYSYLDTLLRVNDRLVENKPFARPVPRFEGKIIFVGQYITGSSDIGPTPLNELAPLVLIHANVVNNILASDFLKRASAWAIWPVALIVGYAGMVVGRRRPIAVIAAFTILSATLYVVGAYAAWIRWSLWLPLIAPLVGFFTLQFVVIARRVIVEQRAKQEVKGMFSTYVSPELVDRMIKSGERPKLGGSNEEITAYFSDIQGFSSFSELLPAERLVELMNEYLTACTDIIQEEGGTLDKYIGDAIVAMFGAPVALPDHAFRACVATQRVQRKLEELRAIWREEGDKWPQIVQQMQSRIGLNSGRCVVGNMGSRTRFNYTMMGDDVNLAARMESGAKSWGVYTMCTEATKAACEKHGGDRLVFRPLGRIVVKGRNQAVPIYEIAGLRESILPTIFDCSALFVQGLERYQARDWDGALDFFRRSAVFEPNIPGKTPGVTSNPSLVYLDIVQHAKSNPPPADWDGAYVMKEK